MASDYMSIDYYGAFSDCSALTAIEIPASVESIGVAAFYGVYLEPSKQLQTMKNTWRQTFVYQLLLDFNTSNLLFGGSQKSAYLCNAFLPRRILRAFILPSRGQS